MTFLSAEPDTSSVESDEMSIDLQQKRRQAQQVSIHVKSEQSTSQLGLNCLQDGHFVAVEREIELERVLKEDLDRLIQHAYKGRRSASKSRQAAQAG